MSRIDDLIAERCRGNVTLVSLDEVVSQVSTIRWADGMSREYIDLAAVDRVLGTVGPTETITRETAPSRAQQVVREGDVLLGATRPMQRRVATVPAGLDGHIASTGFVVLRPSATLLSGFLLHSLRTQHFFDFVKINQRGSNYPSISERAVRRYRVAVPPIQIQREIVAILDRFTQLEAELETELEAELEARRRQYVHYRDRNLTFADNAGTIRRMTVAELGVLFGGLTGKTKADFGGSGERYVSYMNVFQNLTVDQARDDFVQIGATERQRALRRGDILFTGSSENALEAGMTAVVTTEPGAPLFLNSFCIGLRPHDPELLDPEFAKHLFRSGPIRAQIVRTASGVTRFNVSKARLGRVCVPVPPLDEQRRIADTLDAFDALVNDLSIGLPAELEARRAQYAHYRDRLLTFEPAAA